MGKNTIEIKGARTHNLKDISLDIPRDKLVVITGVSGSGKSSLAFDTIYHEGQRRYIESFSSYAKSFLGKIDRPDVDYIGGLSPVISIEQKTVNKSPRSTVGTLTEIYDYLRLLFARVGTAYSHISGKKMIQYSTDEILEKIYKDFEESSVSILAPVVKGRKGHYKELFERYRSLGFLKARVDGVIQDLVFGFHVDRYKTHDIQIMVDRVKVNLKNKPRLKKSVELALKYADNVVMVGVYDHPTQTITQEALLSKNLMDPDSGLSYDVPAPNTFSYNSPYGYCPKCKGIGSIVQVDLEKVFPDKNKSIRAGGIAPLGPYKNNWVFSQIQAILEQHGLSLQKKIKELPSEVLDVLLTGVNQTFQIQKKEIGVQYIKKIKFNGIAEFLITEAEQTSSRVSKRWAESFMNKIVCPQCKGGRLKKESLSYKICDENIFQVSSKGLEDLKGWIEQVREKLSEREQLIANEILKEIKNRLDFILSVGLDYLT